MELAQCVQAFILATLQILSMLPFLRLVVIAHTGMLYLARASLGKCLYSRTPEGGGGGEYSTRFFEYK